MNPNLSALFGWLLRASWQASVLVLVVLAVQWIFWKQLSGRWRYALWLLVMARLALPALPASPVSVFNLAQVSRHVVRPAPAVVPVRTDLPLVPREPHQVAAGLRLADEPFGVSTAGFVTAQAPSPAKALAQAAKPMPLHWYRWENAPSVCAVLWLIGVLSLILRILGQNALFLRRLGAARAVTNSATLALFDQCKLLMGVRVEVRLAETERVKSPALYGLFRTRLLLPAGMTRQFSTGELRHIFLHELAHVKRHDMSVVWAMTLLQVLHWFNPVLWLGIQRMAADREVACDELALSRAGESERRPYGDTILKLLELCARPVAMPGLMGILEDKDQMRRRISMIAAFRQPTRRAALAALLLLVVGLVTLTDAQTAQPAAPPPVKAQTPRTTAVAVLPASSFLETPVRAADKPETATSTNAQRDKPGPSSSARLQTPDSDATAVSQKPPTSYTNITNIEMLRLQGMGRSVTGKLTYASPEAKVDWAKLEIVLVSPPPEPPYDATTREQILAWQQTDAYLAALRKRHSYPGSVAPGGVFQFENVTPGKYAFIATLPDLNSNGLPDIKAKASLYKQVVVPEVPTEKMREPYDLGTLDFAGAEAPPKSPGKVFLIGSVRVSGPMDIPSDEVFTVSKAILRAGGFGDFADRRNVEIRRKSKDGKGPDQKLKADMEQILDKGKSEGDVVLEPQDVIYAPEKLIRF